MGNAIEIIPVETTADVPVNPVQLARREELILEALKIAVSDPREHRLFQSGKLPGLFPNRSSACSDASLHAIKLGLFETTRTEAKGKMLVEWVRATPEAVRYLNQHDSPKAILRELRQTLATTANGVPHWMEETKARLTEMTTTFETQAKALLQQVHNLTRRVDAALRRIEAQGATLPNSLNRLIPWGVAALEYLDDRSLAGAPNPCPLGELFNALSEKYTDLALPQFHDGLRRLHDYRALKLTCHSDLPTDPEYALIIGSELCSFAARTMPG